MPGSVKSNPCAGILVILSCVGMTLMAATAGAQSGPEADPEPPAAYAPPAIYDEGPVEILELSDTALIRQRLGNGPSGFRPSPRGVSNPDPFRPAAFHGPIPVRHGLFVAQRHRGRTNRTGFLGNPGGDIAPEGGRMGRRHGRPGKTGRPAFMERHRMEARHPVAMGAMALGIRGLHGFGRQFGAEIQTAIPARHRFRVEPENLHAFIAGGGTPSHAIRRRPDPLGRDSGGYVLQPFPARGYPRILERSQLVVGHHRWHSRFALHPVPGQSAPPPLFLAGAGSQSRHPRSSRTACW